MKHPKLTTIRACLIPLVMGMGMGLSATPVLAQSNLEQRVARIEQRLDGSALMGLMNQAETLRTEVSTLRGEIEMLQRQIDDLRNQQRQLYLDTDTRLQSLEQNAATPSEPSLSNGADRQDSANNEAGGEPPTPEANARETGSESAQGVETSNLERIRTAYDEAFATLRAGRYAEASQAFEQFLQDYADAELAANARYWLGESYYVVRDFNAALDHFEQVVADHPQSNKRPDALLKIGYVHFEQNRMDQARTALEQVVEEFPESTAANLARQRLDQI